MRRAVIINSAFLGVFVNRSVLSVTISRKPPLSSRPTSPMSRNAKTAISIRLLMPSGMMPPTVNWSMLMTRREAGERRPETIPRRMPKAPLKIRATIRCTSLNMSVMRSAGTRSMIRPSGESSLANGAPAGRVSPPPPNTTNRTQDNPAAMKAYFSRVLTTLGTSVPWV